MRKLMISIACLSFALIGQTASAGLDEYVRDYVPASKEVGKIPKSIQGVWLTKRAIYIVDKDTFRIVVVDPKDVTNMKLVMSKINDADRTQQCEDNDKSCKPHGWNYKLNGNTLTTTTVKNGKKVSQKSLLKSPHPGVIITTRYNEDGTLNTDPRFQGIWVRPEVYVAGLANWTWRSGYPSKRNSDVFVCCDDDRYINFYTEKEKTRNDAFAPYAKQLKFDEKNMIQMYRIFRQPYTMTYTTGGMTEEIYWIPLSLNTWLVKRKNSAGRWTSSAYGVRKLVINEKINDPSFWNRGVQRAGGYESGNIGVIQLNAGSKECEDIAFYPWSKSKTKKPDVQKSSSVEEKELILPDKVLDAALTIIAKEKPGIKKREQLDKILYVVNKEDTLDDLSGMGRMAKAVNAISSTMTYEIQDTIIEGCTGEDAKYCSMKATVIVHIRKMDMQQLGEEFRDIHEDDKSLSGEEQAKAFYKEWAKYIIKNKSKEKYYKLYKSEFELIMFNELTPFLKGQFESMHLNITKADEGRWLINDISGLWKGEEIK